MNEKLYINLTPFKSLNSNVLVGRMNGQYARMVLNLDTVDRWVIFNKYLEVELQLPDDVYVVNDSFLKGLLQETYKSIGHDAFVARVKFTTNNEVLKQELDREIKEFINVLREINNK